MYFDRGFLAQGLPLWRLRAKHDSDSVRWVLALAEFTPDALREVGGMWLRVVPVAEVEVGDAELAAAKANRTRGGIISRSPRAGRGGGWRNDRTSGG